MITLDKEIAEEKVESLEADLLSTTEELAQATTQLNAIEEEKKARLESLNKDGGSGGGSNTEEYPSYCFTPYQPSPLLFHSLSTLLSSPFSFELIF